MKPFQVVSLDFPLIEELPLEVLNARSMMSVDERKLLYTLARNRQGKGKIVDAGVFLGASTICFGAAGAGQIMSYDMAKVTPGMRKFFRRHGIHRDLQDGADITQIIRDNTRGYNVDYRFGDIRNEQCNWLIEICFLDLLKTYDVNRHCIGIFFPNLIEGATVIQQDFFYQHLPYIKIWQNYFADHFEYAGMVRSSGVFRCTKPIGQADVDLYRELSGDELLDLHSITEQAAQADPGRAFACALSRVELMLDLGMEGEAVREFRSVSQTKVPGGEQFAQVVCTSFKSFHKGRL